MSENNIPRVLIPTRGRNSMHRLRKDIDDNVVIDIIEFLLNHTIQEVEKASLNMIILSSDTELTLDFKDLIIKYDDGKSLNKAIENGLYEFPDSRFMLVMPDLPGINKDLIEKVLHLNKLYPFVLVPTHDMGTAIAILPREIFMEGIFGENSAKKIIEYCDQNKLQLGVLETELTDHDLDTLEDLNKWREILEDKIPKIKEITMLKH